MNRREFLRGVLLGAAALVLPKGDKAPHPHPQWAQLAPGDVKCLCYNKGQWSWEWPEHENCRCAYAPIDIGDGQAYYLELSTERCSWEVADGFSDDDADDWLSRIQPQGSFEERAREYLEQMRQVSEACMEYLRGAA